MVVIDPTIYGCMILKNNFRQLIGGTAEECVNKMIDGKLFESCHSIYLDTCGIGMVYADLLDKKNIQFSKIEWNNIV